MSDNLLKEGIYKFNGYSLACSNKLLYYQEKLIRINQKEFECLELLVKNAGTVVSKEEFFSTVWNDSVVEEGVLAVNISNLRKILEKHGEKNTKYIQTIPRNGYRFIVKVENPVENSEFPILPTEVADESDVSKATPKIWKLRKTIVYSLLALTVVLAGFYYYSRQTVFPSQTNKKIAIFPFKNASGNKKDDYLSLAFSNSLINLFFVVPKLDIVPVSEIKGFVAKDFDPIQEGLKSEVDVVVSGSFQTINDKINVKVLITDISGGKKINQQREFVMDRSNMTDLQKNVGIFIFTGLNLNLETNDEENLRKRETQQPQAFEYFLQASNAQSNNEFESAVEFYQKSLAFDPDFDIAAEGLAYTYYTLGNSRGCGEACIEKSSEIYKKLLQKDPNNGRVQVNLAQNLIETNQVEKAIPKLMELIKINSLKFSAYNTLSYGYRYAGQLEESNAFYYKSQEQYFQASLFERGEVFYNNALLYKGAYQEFLNSLKPYPDAPILNFYKGLSYYYLNDFEKAKNEFNIAYNFDRSAMITKIGKGYAYKIDNKPKEALQTADELDKELKENKVYDGEMIYKLAQLYATLNQKKKSLELFQATVDKGFFCYPYFANDSLLLNLKSEPEFSRILEQAKKRHDEFKGQFIN